MYLCLNISHWSYLYTLWKCHNVNFWIQVVRNTRSGNLAIPSAVYILDVVSLVFFYREIWFFFIQSRFLYLFLRFLKNNLSFLVIFLKGQMWYCYSGGRDRRIRGLKPTWFTWWDSFNFMEGIYLLFFSLPWSFGVEISFLKKARKMNSHQCYYFFFTKWNFLRLL